MAARAVNSGTGFQGHHEKMRRLISCPCPLIASLYLLRFHTCELMRMPHNPAGAQHSLYSPHCMGEGGGERMPGLLIGRLVGYIQGIMAHSFFLSSSL